MHSHLHLFIQIANKIPKPQTKLKWKVSQREDPQKPCLLDLPADILLLIYEAVLLLPNHIYPARQITTMPLFHPPRSKETTQLIPYVPNFLATCAQIHAEAANVFYAKNIFYITDNAHDFVHEPSDVGLPFSTAGKHVAKFAPRYAPLVRHIVFQHHEGSPHNWDWTWELVTWIKEVKHWPNLRQLKLELAWEAWGLHIYLEDAAWRTEDGREKVVKRLVKMLKNICAIHEVKVPKGLTVEPILVLHGDVSGRCSSDLEFGVLRQALDVFCRKQR